MKILPNNKQTEKHEFRDKDGIWYNKLYQIAKSKGLLKKDGSFDKTRVITLSIQEVWERALPAQSKGSN